MLTLPAPTPLIGDLLRDDLAAAGLTTTVALDGDTVVMAGLDESQRNAASTVVSGHPARAKAATDTAKAEQSNATTLRDRAVQALDTNRAFLALTAPTNAQTLAEVKALARQNNGLIRLLLQRFDGTD